MKLFEMEGFLRGKCLPGDMKVNETNAEYLVRKFAEAEARCAALAAENAGLKEDRDTLARYWIEDGGDEDCAMSYCEPTPSTDAFLAEVRAEAIRDALDASSDSLDTDCVMDRLDISYEDAELRTSGAIELHDALVAVANELRKGTAQ